jgi:hypothetical protein
MSENKYVMINEYFREGTKTVGAIVAVLKDNVVHVGVSKCHPADVKKYNNKLACQIATERALNEEVVSMNLSYRHVEQVRDFIEVRCPKYFKRKASAHIAHDVISTDEFEKVIPVLEKTI